MDLKTIILSHIKERYVKTRWPYTYKKELQRLTGENIESALLEMRKEGIIDFSIGILGTLIVYEEGRIENEKQRSNTTIKRKGYGKQHF